MIISIGGKPGTGKSTIAKLLAKQLKYKHYSSGDFTRQIAEKRGISLLELARLEEIDKKIDEEVDRKQIELGKKQDNFVIDSRLGFHFIPNSKKIFLDAAIEIRAKRIFSDKKRKEDNKDVDTTKKNILKREKSEIKRYKSYYDINPYDKKHYDMIIDTSKLGAGQITAKIADFLTKNS